MLPGRATVDDPGLAHLVLQSLQLRIGPLARRSVTNDSQHRALLTGRRSKFIPSPDRLMCRPTTRGPNVSSETSARLNIIAVLRLV